MNPSEIIVEVAKLGVVLRVEGTNLVHRGPRGALRPELIARLKAHKPAIVAELTGATARALFPADVAERSAITLGSDQSNRNAADRHVPAEASYCSWQAIGAAERAQIGAALVRLPMPSAREGVRLLQETKQFIASKWFNEAVRSGWTLEELFGLDSVVPLHEAAWGLVVGLALAPAKSDEIISIDDAAAVIRFKSAHGWQRRRERRFQPPIDSVCWWQCDELIGSKDKVSGDQQ